jgi:hypothetical protein
MAESPGRRGRRSTVLGPDDKQVFADPPAGFNAKREEIPHGPHVWNADSNGHDPTHWRNNMYHFVQHFFR